MSPWECHDVILFRRKGSFVPKFVAGHNSEVRARWSRSSIGVISTEDSSLKPSASFSHRHPPSPRPFAAIDLRPKPVTNFVSPTGLVRFAVFVPNVTTRALLGPPLRIHGRASSRQTASRVPLVDKQRTHAPSQAAAVLRSNTLCSSRSIFLPRTHIQGKETRKDPAENWYQGEIGFFDFYVIPLAK
jgi:hypothetical protein